MTAPLRRGLETLVAAAAIALVAVLVYTSAGLMFDTTDRVMTTVIGILFGLAIAVIGLLTERRP